MSITLYVTPYVELRWCQFRKFIQKPRYHINCFWDKTSSLYSHLYSYFIVQQCTTSIASFGMRCSNLFLSAFAIATGKRLLAALCKQRKLNAATKVNRYQRDSWKMLEGRAVSQTGNALAGKVSAWCQPNRQRWL